MTWHSKKSAKEWDISCIFSSNLGSTAFLKPVSWQMCLATCLVCLMLNPRSVAIRDIPSWETNGKLKDLRTGLFPTLTFTGWPWQLARDMLEDPSLSFSFRTLLAICLDVVSSWRSGTPTRGHTTKIFVKFSNRISSCGRCVRILISLALGSPCLADSKIIWFIAGTIFHDPYRAFPGIVCCLAILHPGSTQRQRRRRWPL